jgi:hypothetical protein
MEGHVPLPGKLLQGTKPKVKAFKGSLPQPQKPGRVDTKTSQGVELYGRSYQAWDTSVAEHGRSLQVWDENACNEAEEQTTIVVRNLPPNYNLAMMFEDIVSMDAIDLAYIPVVENTFIVLNFLRASEATEFRKTWNRQRLPKRGVHGPIRVGVASLQGCHATLKQLEKSLARQAETTIFYRWRFIHLAEAVQVAKEECFRAEDESKFLMVYL